MPESFSGCWKPWRLKLNYSKCKVSELESSSLAQGDSPTMECLQEPMTKCCHEVAPHAESVYSSLFGFTEVYRFTEV